MEFLPLCDVLFNVISLAGYFCDVVFDIVMGYALLERGYRGTFAAAMSIVVTSLVISQVISLRWYLHVWWADSSRKGRPPWLPIMLHCLQCGVLWRYARLLVPVELRHVKHQVRDLCMLRLVHGFCSAAPMLLLQLHVMYKHSAKELRELGAAPEPSVLEPPANKAFAELVVISASLSLFSVCWALASFSKNVRLQNVHRLVLTWLGVIFQFLWRLGTVSARICALTVYALVYEYWVFLVIGLHWLSMFLWLISPKNVFHGERISRPRKAYLSALIAFVYVFAYINLHEINHRQKMVTFYLVMCVENCVLVFAWWLRCPAPRPEPALVVSAGFGAGLGFMLLYYRYFHVRRLGYMLGENQQGTNSTTASSQSKKGKQSNQTDNAAIPGVFNCRFTNPSGNARKKKKPTSFVPPPPAPRLPAPAFWRRPLPTHNHHGGSSENEGSSVGSRVNIQQKLQEKKQKQLAELRVIEEEIKQGKLSKTTPVAEEIYSSIQRQPIPRAKTHADQPAWPSIEMTHPYQNYPVIPHNCNYPTYTEIKNYTTQNENNQNGFQFYDTNAIRPNYGDRFNYSEGNRMSNIYEERQVYSYENKDYGIGSRAGYECGYGQNCGRLPYGKKEQARKMQRCRTPEILLAPHYLERCCHWEAPYTTRKKEEKGGGSSGEESPAAGGGAAPAPHSDIDSQISLPRSYTLPREFRYWRRRPRLRDAHVASNNSSDGDVDSGDDSDRRSNWSCASQQHDNTYCERRTRRPPNKPQTRL